MRKTLVGAALAALAMLAVIAVSSALATPAHKGHGGDRGLTIHVVEHAETDALVDNPPAKDSIGDTLAFGNDIYDATDTTKVGTDAGSCVRTVPAVSYECTWTTTLAKGQITVEGPFLDAGDSTLAITGGTAAYRDAGGTMDLHARNAKEFDFTFHVIAKHG